MKKLLLFALLGLFSTSCISTKVHKTLQEKYDILANEADQLRQKNEVRDSENTELQRTLTATRRDVLILQEDTTSKFDELRALTTKYDRLSKQYDYLLDNNNTLITASARENKTLMDQLNTMQTRLQAKEDSLNTERRLLERGQRRVNELEGVINRKDSTVAYVRQKVSDALLGFNGNGLTVNMREGKVYVSLENSLLFAPGSWNVAANGQVALENLAKVLAENADITVLVEGHTDNDAYRGQSQVKDNWDLSVLRATNVVKILTKNAGMNPERITAAGRGEFVPLVDNSSEENKAINRRTEIILTPDLTELANLLEGDK
ncbi:MAG TPA: cell envelope biogenesis protein OmpA [Cryomorphaceae bacterium]|nr:cell envelope biogenesis protein OmpA [Cryomorphaceae bacterium]HCY25755.1 cell envelope biogenesis protein OmpA [Cryomorphaceae bacterium]|tara:strand:- start:550 stop:1509 length:960 start_codon:yes stop_codon:yes gene_type:complete